jgi:hypothetical protein
MDARKEETSKSTPLPPTPNYGSNDLDVPTFLRNRR